MAIYDLSQSDLNYMLLKDGVDLSVRKAVIDYLSNDGLLHGNGTVVVQEGGVLDPSTQVLIVDNNSPTTVVTDPNLQVIVDTAQNPSLTVTGNTSLLIEDSPSSDPLPGNGHGFDDNTLFCNDGEYQTLMGGNGNDMPTPGSGNNQWPEAGDTLSSGIGNGTQFGYVGSTGWTGGSDYIGAQSNNESNVASDMTTHSGVTTLQFSDNQSSTTSNAETLVFTDNNGNHK
jgi:hypothetical protein